MEATPHTALAQDVQAGQALTIRRKFTSPGVHPFDTVEWELRDARIGHGGKVAFEQDGVEFPRTWSQNATNIVAQKYFRGQLDSPARERSVKQMICRVAGTIADWGRARGYFATPEDGDSFEAELTYILLHQMAAFNSPGLVQRRLRGARRSARPASSSASRTTMESILDWNTKEGKIFRGGSGSGINLSNIRGSMEPLARAARRAARSRSCAAPTRGRARSSRAARRAARRRWSSSTSTTRTSASSSGARRKEEDKAEALRDAGFDMSIDGDGFTSIQYQNANNSVRVTDEFMHAVENDEDWRTTARATGEPVGEPIPRARAHARDRRGRVALRRPGRPVRHDDQPVAHVAELGAHQRVEPVLGVHARRRQRVQPRVAEPHEVPPRRTARSTSTRSSTPSTSSSSRRRSSSGRRATRPRRSASTPARSASSASATPTSAPT